MKNRYTMFVFFILTIIILLGVLIYSRNKTSVSHLSTTCFRFKNAFMNRFLYDALLWKAYSMDKIENNLIFISVNGDLIYFFYFNKIKKKLFLQRKDSSFMKEFKKDRKNILVIMSKKNNYLNELNSENYLVSKNGIYIKYYGSINLYDYIPEKILKKYPTKKDDLIGLNEIFIENFCEGELNCDKPNLDKVSKLYCKRVKEGVN